MTSHPRSKHSGIPERWWPRCRTCVYFDPDRAEGVHLGICRKSSPPWPIAHLEDWCGAYQHNGEES